MIAGHRLDDLADLVVAEPIHVEHVAGGDLLEIEVVLLVVRPDDRVPATKHRLQGIVGSVDDARRVVTGHGDAHATSIGRAQGGWERIRPEFARRWSADAGGAVRQRRRPGTPPPPEEVAASYICEYLIGGAQTGRRTRSATRVRHCAWTVDRRDHHVRPVRRRCDESRVTQGIQGRCELCLTQARAIYSLRLAVR